MHATHTHTHTHSLTAILKCEFKYSRAVSPNSPSLIPYTCGRPPIALVTSDHSAHPNCSQQPLHNPKCSQHPLHEQAFPVTTSWLSAFPETTRWSPPVVPPPHVSVLHFKRASWWYLHVIKVSNRFLHDYSPFTTTHRHHFLLSVTKYSAL